MADYNSLLQGPTTSGATLDTTQPGVFSKLLNSPAFLSLLAGVGAGLDPKGAGGAFGNAAQGAIQSKAAQATAKDIQEAQIKRHAELIDLGNKYLTAPGEKGDSSISHAGDKFSIKGDGPEGTTYTNTYPIPAPEAGSPVSSNGQYPLEIPAGTPPITQTPLSPSVPVPGLSTSPQVSASPAVGPRTRASDFIPFYQAPPV